MVWPYLPIVIGLSAWGMAPSHVEAKALIPPDNEDGSVITVGFRARDVGQAHRLKRNLFFFAMSVTNIILELVSLGAFLFCRMMEVKMKRWISCSLVFMSAVIAIPTLWAQGSMHSGAVGGGGRLSEYLGDTMPEVPDGHDHSNSDQSGNEGPVRPNPDPNNPESNPFFNGGHNPYLRPNPFVPSRPMPITLYSAREVNQALRNGYVVTVTTDLARCTVNAAAKSSVTHTGMQIQDYYIDDNQNIIFSATTKSIKTNSHRVIKTQQDYQINGDGNVTVKVLSDQPFAGQKNNPASYLCVIGRGILFRLHAD